MFWFKKEAYLYKMGKVLAIDFGIKRCGLAISDENIFFAFPLKTVDSTRLINELKSLFLDEQVGVIVIGFPKRLDNTLFEISNNILLLKKELNKQFPDKNVELIDERFTSKIASQTIAKSGVSKKKRQDKSIVDKLSATLILQSFIEKNVL